MERPKNTTFNVFLVFIVGALAGAGAMWLNNYGGAFIIRWRQIPPLFEARVLVDDGTIIRCHREDRKEGLVPLPEAWKKLKTNP